MAGVCAACGNPTTDTRAASEAGVCTRCEELVKKTFSNGATYNTLFAFQQALIRTMAEAENEACRRTEKTSRVPLDEQAPDPNSTVTDLSHPFADAGRRADITFWPPNLIMTMPRARIVTIDEVGKAIEFTDERGNFYRIANVPYSVVSYDPKFDPETEGRIIRTPGGKVAAN